MKCPNCDTVIEDDESPLVDAMMFNDPYYICPECDAKVYIS